MASLVTLYSDAIVSKVKHFDVFKESQNKNLFSLLARSFKTIQTKELVIPDSTSPTFEFLVQRLHSLDNQESYHFKFSYRNIDTSEIVWEIDGKSLVADSDIKGMKVVSGAANSFLNNVKALAKALGVKVDNSVHEMEVRAKLKEIHSLAHTQLRKYETTDNDLHRLQYPLIMYSEFPGETFERQLFVTLEKGYETMTSYGMDFVNPVIIGDPFMGRSRANYYAPQARSGSVFFKLSITNCFHQPFVELVLKEDLRDRWGYETLAVYRKAWHKVGVDTAIVPKGKVGDTFYEFNVEELLSKVEAYFRK